MSVLLSLVLLLAPVKAEHGQFNIMKDGKKIGAEEFTLSKTGSGYSLEGKTTIGDLTITSQMELDDKLAPASYTVSSKEGTIRVKVASPISELQTAVNGHASASADFRFPDGGVILDNNFFHHYLILLYRVHTGLNTFPVFVPQDMRVGSATVRSTGPRTYDLEVGDVKLQGTTDADGRLIRLTVPSANVVVER
jgi:hypothetical protein